MQVLQDLFYVLLQLLVVAAIILSFKFYSMFYFTCDRSFKIIIREPDISDPGHFGPKTIRTHKIRTKVTGHVAYNHGHWLECSNDRSVLTHFWHCVSFWDR